MAIDSNHIQSLTPQPAEDSGTRKLAAIMFTDIKDFSRRMQKDEAATMRMLKVHNTMMEEAVIKYDGKVIKTVGDAFLVSFDSVVSATQCAIEVQQKFYDYNRNIKQEDDKIAVRIGIHLGDVIVKEHDVFGDGVNIASRIQSLAEVGGVNISDSVYQQVKNKIAIRVLDMGVPQLKGIDERVRIYQVIIIPTEKARGKLATELYVFKTILKRKKTKRNISIGTAALAVIAWLWIFVFGYEPPENSIAVMPFKNIGDTANVYIADNFAADLVSSLSQLPGIQVLSIGVSFKYKDTEMSEKDVARELDVRYLLTGSIEIRKDEITVRARLTEPAQNIDVWSQNITKTTDELIGIQHEIFRQVALRFESAMREAGVAQTSSEVYDLYLRGLEYDRRERKEDNQLAISFFKRAIEKDTNFIQGYIKLASSQMLNLERKYDVSEKWLAEAETNINKAFKIDTNNAEIYWLLGRLEFLRGNRARGIANIEKAIQKDPTMMRAYQILGRQYLHTDPEKAIFYLTKAYEIEPTNYNNSVNLGIANAMLKKYRESIEAFLRAARLNPKHELPWLNLGYLYERIGALDSASAAYKNALERNPASERAAHFYSLLLLNQNRVELAEVVLKEGLRFNPTNYDLLYTMGIVYTKRGQQDRAREVWNRGLRFSESAVAENPNIAKLHSYVGLFTARLGRTKQAIASGIHAFSVDSTDYEIVYDVARIYAVLGHKQDMLEWFVRARRMNSEYDEQYVLSDIDFERYRKDEDLLFVARR